MVDYSSIIKSVLDSSAQLEKGNTYLSLWEKWYKGYDPSFHRYTVYNGQKKVRRVKKSLKMFKKVCEDWASLLLNEKTQIGVKDQEKLDNLLTDIDFWGKANKSVEYGFALSMSALVINIENLTVLTDENGSQTIIENKDAKIDVQLIPARHIVPLTFVGREITECAFAFNKGDKTEVAIHRKNEEGKYEIVKLTIDEMGKQIGEVVTLLTESTTPYFAIIQPNIVNNLDLESAYPISICGNAVDILKHIDDVFESYNNEFVLGKKRTYVSSELNQVDEKTGEVRRTFDPDDVIVYQLPKGASINGDDKPLIYNVTDSLRSMEHQAALKDALNMLSAAVGLGTDYYNFDKGRVMTATQVISEKSDTFRNMKKHEILIEKALITLTRSLMNAYNTFVEKIFTDTENVDIRFDDSIIEDKATEKENDKKDVELGVMSKLEFRQKWYGETEEVAREKLKEVGSPDTFARAKMYGELLTQGVITPEIFVNFVFPNEKNKEELTSQIAENIKSASGISEADVLNLKL